jgi:hypothetical protein
MVKPVTLIAMAPSGATLVVRDDFDRVWLYPPQGAGQPQVMDPDFAEWVIAHNDLDRIGRDFASWDALEAFRQERARRVTPQTIVDFGAFDAHDVEQLLEVAEEWLADGDAHRTRALVLALLRAPVTLSSPELHARLIDCLERLGEPVIALRSAPRTPLQAAARERWRQQRAA